MYQSRTRLVRAIGFVEEYADRRLVSRSRHCATCCAGQGGSMRFEGDSPDPGREEAFRRADASLSILALSVPAQTGAGGQRIGEATVLSR